MTVILTVWLLSLSESVFAIVYICKFHCQELRSHVGSVLGSVKLLNYPKGSHPSGIAWDRKLCTSTSGSAWVRRVENLYLSVQFGYQQIYDIRLSITKYQVIMRIYIPHIIYRILLLINVSLVIYYKDFIFNNWWTIVSCWDSLTMWL